MSSGENVQTVRQLFKATLRLRPDLIVVGEIRGGEALELIQAMTSGHGGCLATVHATYPMDTLQRLETMCLMSDIALPLLSEIPIVSALSGYLFHPAYRVTSVGSGDVVLRCVKQAAFFEGRFRIEPKGAQSEEDERLGVIAILMVLLLERARG